MATWDKAYLLAQFDRYAHRPTTDAITDESKYQRLSEAQMAVIESVAAIYPYCLYRSGGPTALSTSDSKVYTFGNDGNNENAQGPLGHVAVFRNLEDYPDNPLIEGIDYLDEGTQIRIPNNRTEQATLYWTGIPTPIDISATNEPVLRPAPARILIVIKAVERFALEGGHNPALAADMKQLWAEEFPKHMLAWKTRFRRGGAISLDGIERAIARQQI
jgi:hypothetical protein